MRGQFNVYHFFAGAFVPAWLLSREEVGAGAKLAYALLAQQANSNGVTQLNLRMQATALGDDEGQLARHLMELEEAGLIQVSRGNVHQQDIRVYFPCHPWMAGLKLPPPGGAIQPAAPEPAGPTLSPVGTVAQASLLPVRSAAVDDTPIRASQMRHKTRNGRPGRRP